MNTSANNISLHNNNVTSTSPVFLEFKMLYNFMFCVKFLITFNVFVISMYFKYVFVFLLPFWRGLQTMIFCTNLLRLTYY